MKKRLRKKLHKAEFAEFGRRVVIEHSDGDSDMILDLLIEAVEAEGCCCGGGTSPSHSDLVIELGRKSDRPDDRFQRILDRIKTSPSVRRIRYSDPFDLWHGPADAPEPLHQS